MTDARSAAALADRTRADLAEPIDRQMAPLGLAVLAALALHRQETVLDVGCGAGGSLLPLADRVGTEGRVVGVDVAPAVLAVARERTRHRSEISILQADAAHLALPDASFDAVHSRFGTMFFADPVAAFGNLRRMLRNDGRIGFVCWRGIGENELDRAPLEAAGLAFDAAPHASLADAQVIERVLREAGFHRIAVRPFDAPVGCGGVEATLDVVLRVGALGRVLRERPELRADAEPRIRRMLEARAVGNHVTLGAATWIVTAAANGPAAR